MAKFLVVTIKMPLPEGTGKLAELVIIQMVKKLIPVDKLPPGSSVDHAIVEEKKEES